MLALCVSATPRWRIGGVQAKLHAFVISAFEGGVWSASRSKRFKPAERSANQIGGWVGLTAGLDVVARNNNPALLGIELRAFARSESLHWLSYTCPFFASVLLTVVLPSDTCIWGIYEQAYNIKCLQLVSKDARYFSTAESRTITKLL